MLSFATILRLLSLSFTARQVSWNSHQIAWSERHEAISFIYISHYWHCALANFAMLWRITGPPKGPDMRWLSPSARPSSVRRHISQTKQDRPIVTHSYYETSPTV